MAVYRCKTHNISYDTETHRFETPPGSWGGIGQCELLLLKDPKPGKYNECEIEEVG